MVTPLKWISDKYQENWIFVDTNNNTKTWIEYFLGKIYEIYTIVSIETDFYGYPVVIISSNNNTNVYKITDGILYWGSNLTIIDFEYRYGSWATKSGIKFRFELFRKRRLMRIKRIIFLS